MYHCPSKRGAVLPKVAFLAIVITSAVTFHMRADSPQMRAPTLEALNSALLCRETPRPLVLVMRSVIRLPPLLMPRFGPRWSTYPLRLLWALTFYLIFHLLHHSAFSTSAAKSLMENGATFRRISPLRPFSNFWHLHSSSSDKV